MRANLRAGRARVNTAALAAGSAVDASPRPCTAVSFRALPPSGRANSSSTALVLPLLLGCAGKPAARTAATPAPTPIVRPFAALAEQRVIVAPAYRIREADPTRLARADPAHARVPARARRRDRARSSPRAGSRRSGSSRPTSPERRERNPTYAVDPYALAAEPLRASNVAPEAELGDPLATSSAR